MKSFFLYFFLFFLISIRAQHQDNVDFLRAKVDIDINTEDEGIEGKVSYQFTALKKLDSFFLDARDLSISTVHIDNRKVKFQNDGKTLRVYKRLRQNKSYTLDISYWCRPKQTVYFTGWNDQGPIKQVWTQGQGKYTSHWLPSFDDMEEKVEFDLSIAFEKDYTVIANGTLLAEEEVNGRKKWSFDMDRPMSSYLLAFAIGNYSTKQILSDKGTPIRLNFYPTDSLLVEPTYRYTKDILDFLEREIGVPYPWSKYELVPVRDFLYAGMENTGNVIFSDNYMIDSIVFKDHNFVNVNAHEMAHQWFGDLVTQKDGHAHWLHEGFATYYALLAEKEIFGDPYYYWKLYGSARDLKAATENDRGEALLDPKAGSATFYEKGAWAVHMLRKQLGEIAFKKGIVGFLEKYGFRNAGIADFLKEMEQASGTDLGPYKRKWLEGKEFPYLEVKATLMSESKDLQQFFKLQEELVTDTNDRETIIRRYWDNTESILLRAKIIETYYKMLPEEFLAEAFGSGNVTIRQALAVSAGRVPMGLRKEFESLLNDESYVTIEHILYKLWIHFPTERIGYLDRTKNITGFPDRNIRILWLTLALLTKEYDPHKSGEYYKELSGYTSAEYPFEVRQNAFRFLYDTIGFSDRNLLDLIQAAQHRTWQFKKFAGTMLDQLLEQEGHKIRIEKLLGKLNEAELRYMKSKLKKQ